jgi:hypothetical protein
MVAQTLRERTDVDPAEATMADLETLLQRKLRGVVHELRLRPRDQGVSLHGYAYTYYAKQLAQHVFMSATTMALVSNEIAVI